MYKNDAQRITTNKNKLNTMENTEEKFVLELIIEKLEDLKVDNQKLYIKNNKSAATRIRSVYTEVQKMMQDEKKHILEFKKALPTKTK